MGKIIVLRFDTKREVGIVKSLMKKGMEDPDLAAPVKGIASGIIQQLDRCIKAFDNPENSGLRVVEDAGVDIKAGKTDATAYQRAPVDPKKEYIGKIYGKKED